MDSNGKQIILACDISTKTIGITLLIDDGSDYGKIIEMTHISPKVSSKIKGIKALCEKKIIFDDFIKEFKGKNIDRVVFEEPLLSSNNKNTVGTLLRFNGMLSSSVYEILGIAPDFISSYDARKYSFPDLMSVRKKAKSEVLYESKKIIKSVKNANFTLFGSYPWDIEKKHVIQQKVAKIFPNIEWLYDKNDKLKEENFDATDSYVAALGFVNKQKYGELLFTVSNIVIDKEKVNYDAHYWGKTEHRETFFF